MVCLQPHIKGATKKSLHAIIYFLLTLKVINGFLVIISWASASRDKLARTNFGLPSKSG